MGNFQKINQSISRLEKNIQLMTKKIIIENTFQEFFNA